MNKQCRNIVLIGMPGCGKTTIGKMLSKITEMEFCDLDEYVVRISGKTIKEMFKNGEEYFRQQESKGVEMISDFKDYIVSTGGGIVKKEKNIELLRKNGIIIFINRPIDKILEDIDTENRPLLKDKNNLIKLYNERYELYKKYSDFEIINDGDIEETLNKILCIIHKV